VERAKEGEVREGQERWLTKVHDARGEGVLEVQVLDLRQHIADCVVASQRLEDRHNFLSFRDQLESRVLEEL
jgi:hypothetical protein